VAVPWIALVSCPKSGETEAVPTIANKARAAIFIPDFLNVLVLLFCICIMAIRFEDANLNRPLAWLKSQGRCEGIWDGIQE
jgi:hypothetical protein